MAAEAAPRRRNSEKDTAIAWVFTIHAENVLNAPQEWLDSIKGNAKVTYIIFQLEVGEKNHRLHAQGYIRFKYAIRMPAVKEILRENTAHVNIAEGSWQSNVEYCSKEEGHVSGPYEYGERPKQGKRSDLLELFEKAKSGASDKELCDEHLVSFAKFSKQAVMIRNMYTEPEYRDVKVYTIVGPTGTGKSHALWEAFGLEAYRLPICGYDNVQWFDGYAGQKVLLIEEFDGDLSRPITNLLAWLDKYPIQVRTQMMGFIYARWKMVVFTCNRPPNEWYHTHGEVNKNRFVSESQVQALDRRLRTGAIFTLEDRSEQAPIIQALKDAYAAL